jgi:tetratricopeptide (TPR) repeat protein
MSVRKSLVDRYDEDGDDGECTRSSLFNVPSSSASPAPSSSSAPSSSDFPKLGLKLSYFEEFVKQCGGKDSFRDLTTNGVCKQFVLPMTLHAENSLCSVLSAQGDPAVAIASVFISHSWKCLFLDILDALLHQFHDQPDIVVWFDLFSNNQHSTWIRPFEWWCGTFRSAIAEFGHVVMVMAPWSDPIPLTRAWCLFELYCIADTPNGKFEVAMSRSEQAKFLDSVSEDPEAELNNMLAAIDCERSECNKPADRDAIFAVVREVIGFMNINKIVFEQLRNWMISVTEAAVQAEPVENRKILFEHTLAQIYRHQGMYDKAEPLFASCVEQRTQSLGDMHPDTLTSTECLALLYSAQGKYLQAEPLFLSCLARRAHVFGEMHPSTLSLVNDLGLLYTNQGKYDAAETLCISCLEKRKVLLGEDHPDTLRSTNNLALLYTNQGKYTAAEPLHVLCLKKRTATLGDHHLDTLRSMNNLALLYNNQRLYDRAEPLFLSCLALSSAVLGENHPDTLRAVNNVAVLYFHQELYDKAEAFFISSFRKREVISGVDHPLTLLAMNNLAKVYDQQAKYVQAEELSLCCLAKQKIVLGHRHPDTLRSLHNLAAIYINLGRLDEAEMLFELSFEGRKAVLGDNHPDTIASMSNLTHLRRSRGQTETAEQPDSRS